MPEVTCGALSRATGVGCHGASVEGSDPSPAPSASVVNPVVAGPGLSGSPAVGVCVSYEAAPGGGGGLDVMEQEETLSSEELLWGSEEGACLQAPVGPG